MKFFSFSFRIYANAALEIDPTARRARSARSGGTPAPAAKIIVLPQKTFCHVRKPSRAVLHDAHFNVCCSYRSSISYFDSTVEGRGWLRLASGNQSGWLLPYLRSQLRKARTNRSAWVGVKVNLLYCAFTSPPCARNPFSCPCNTIISPSYTLLDVQCSCQRGTNCHQAGPGMVKRKKLRALQTMDRVLPGAIGMLKEHINISQFFSPKNGSFTGSSILQSHTGQCLRSSIQKYESTNQTTPHLILCLLQP